MHGAAAQAQDVAGDVAAGRRLVDAWCSECHALVSGTAAGKAGPDLTAVANMFGRLDVDVVMPQPDEIDFIHNAYLDVVYDRSTPAGIDRLRELAHTLIRREGAEAVLLAGTDLSMVLNEENAGFPTLDCAGVHIAEITKRLLD